MEELENFRREKDHFFASHPQSPLTPEQKTSFQGLHYYPSNPALRFELDVERAPAGAAIEMPTSTGDSAVYTRLGTVQFPVDGETVQLTVFTDDGSLFLPFADAEAGRLTYGAGRYVEPEHLPNGKLLVDFNLAYNPYCAYNDRWSCPLTPLENRLKVAIRAGEQVFEH